MSNVTRIVVQDEGAVAKTLRNIVSDLAKAAIADHGSFNIGLSGGSMVKFVSHEFGLIETDWSKWKFFFCDERLVPVEDKDSTLKLYLDGLVQPGTTGITREQFVEVNTGLDVKSAALDYEKKLKTTFGAGVEWPSFDVLLLGMGPDGHTASLFPGHALLEENKAWIAPISDSPKPPPERVTMTFPVIHSAKTCIFAMAGQGKADMLKKIFVDKESLPSARVNESKGKVIWIMDQAAANLLPLS